MKLIYKWKSILILFGVMFGLFLQADVSAQSSVRGVVTADEDGIGLPGVTVLLKGTTVGTVTDVDGVYEISVPDANAVLVFSYIGYETQEIIAGTRSQIDLALKANASVLDEVVVIGYGEQSRTTLSNAVSKLDNRVLENIPFAQAASALQGTVAGLRVQTTSGQPGALPRVILRGGNSINSPNGASPLYIIDGIIRNDMEDINPADIESVQVLKDAASTAIYGARGANGVIIITTKTGAGTAPKISYNYSLGTSQLGARYDLVDARDYIFYGRLGIAATGEKHPERLSRLNLPVGAGTGNDLTNFTAFTTQFLTDDNKHKLNEGWESMPDPLDPSKTIIFQNTDWTDILFRTGITQNHYLSFSGGNEKSNFDLGIGYLDGEGAAIETGFKRFTGKLNGDLRVRDNVNVFGKISFSNTSDEQVYNTNHLFQRAIGLPPTAKLTYEDGTYATGQNRSIGNPLYHLSRFDRDFQETQISLVGGLDWEIVPGLVFSPYASFFREEGLLNTFQKSYFNNPTQFRDSRDARADYEREWINQYEAVLTYSKSIDFHNFQVKGGASIYNRENYGIDARGRGAASDLIPTLNAAAEPTLTSSAASQQKIIGFFGRATYDFDQKYLFSASARYDGASNLGGNKRWGFFPGGSVGWNVHKEPFWDNMPDAISRLKIRASYGVNGNLGNLSDFHAQGQYSVGDRYNGQAAVSNTRLENQDLQWEESTTFDVGFDVGFWNDRVNVLVDFYRKVTDNLLTNLALPRNTGFSSILTNFGSLQNKGVELELNAGVIRAESGFSWDLGFNTAFNNDEVLELPENNNENNRIGGILVSVGGEDVWVGGIQEGQELGSVFTYMKTGVYATDQAAAEGPIDELVPGSDKTKLGGDAIFLDVNNDGVINTLDRVYVGSIYPDWTGGVSSFMSYKGFGLTIRADFALGHTIRNRQSATYLGQWQGDIGIISDVKNSWLQQGDVTNISRYYWADQLAQNSQFRRGGGSDAAGNIFINSDFNEKGDYLALREVTVSYTFTNNPLLEKAGVANLRLYASGNNLKYFTAYTGLLPEDGGLDNGRYPNPRNFTFGANVTF